MSRSSWATSEQVLTRRKPVSVATGRQGRSREKFAVAGAVTQEIVESILADLPFRGGDESGMLVNGLRSTPLTALYIVFRKTAQMLDTAGFLADVDGGTAA
jgi:dihydroxyacetone kinase